MLQIKQWKNKIGMLVGAGMLLTSAVLGLTECEHVGLTEQDGE